MSNFRQMMWFAVVPMTLSILAAITLAAFDVTYASTVGQLGACASFALATGNRIVNIRRRPRAVIS